jgi:yeast amino acid transporter
MSQTTGTNYPRSTGVPSNDSVFTESSGLSVTAAKAGEEPQGLRLELRHFQVFFILIAGIIGASIFTSNGEGLKIAGPLAMMTGVLYAGFVAVGVGETVSE